MNARTETLRAIAKTLKHVALQFRVSADTARRLSRGGTAIGGGRTRLYRGEPARDGRGGRLGDNLVIELAYPFPGHLRDMFNKTEI